MSEQTLEQKQAEHDKLMATCDALNNQLQAQGLPLVVIPVRTLLKMQAMLEQRSNIAESLAAKVDTALKMESLDPDWGVDIGMAGGSPRPEHVHLCRDTAQDILNSKQKRG